VVISIIQGLLLVIIIFEAFPVIITPEGGVEDLTVFGTMTYVVLVVAVLMQIHAQTYSYTWLYLLSQVFSIISLIIFLLIVTETNFPTDELLGVGFFFRHSPVVLFNVFLTSSLCVLPSYALFSYLDLFTSKFITKFRVSYSLAIPNVSSIEKYKDRLESLYKNSSSWKNKSIEDQLSMNKFTLQFSLKHIEKKYVENFITENLTLFKWTIAILWALIILWTVFGALVTGEDERYILARVIISSACSLMLFILWTNHFKKNFQIYILLMIFVALITKFALEIGFRNTSILSAALIPSVTFLILNVQWLGTLILNILNLFLFICSITVEYSSQYNASEQSLLAVTQIIFILAIISTSSLVGYFLETSNRIEYRLNNKAHNGIEQIESVLKIMLPPFVRNRVKEGARYIAEDQGEVTILFCDICDFEGICKEYTPQELTSFLDYIFSSFDTLCEKIGVTKIETVGKTYMACAGLKDSDKDISAELRQHPHARRCIEVALAILQDVKSIQLKNGNKLQVKIGINTGPVSAGVVGHHKPQFSLVGDTVNTASRMCSTLDSPNSIQISASSHVHLKNYDDLEFFHKEVYAKGKGNIHVFKVTEAKPDNSDIAGGLLGHYPSSSAIINIPSSFLDSSTEPRQGKTIRNDNRKSRAWREEILQRQNSNLIQTHPRFKVSLKESIPEREFRLKRLEKNYWSILISLSVATATLCLMTIFAACEWAVLGEYTNEGIIISRAVVVAYLICVLFLHSRIYMKIYYPYLIIFSLVLMIVTVMLQLSFRVNLPQDMIGLEIMYIIVILNHSSAASLPLVLLVNVLIFIPWIVLAVGTAHQSLHLTNALMVAGFSLINFKAIFQQEKNDRANYNLNLLAEKEIEASENLLKQMMPPHVLENLEKGKSVTDRLHHVTLIFADIVGFTDWSSSKRPEEIVKMLSNLFTRFDILCIKYDVYKVHTIGDCYVVMGDVGRRNRDPSLECLNVMKMAYSMIEVIKEENLKHSSSLDMRIGVHTGEVIAGVIGTNIVRYDIWGPDVLIANKMESKGTPGRVKCSEDTRLMLESREADTFDFEESLTVEVPEINISKKSFYVTRKDLYSWIS
jgi:class 3 adenylate cyclase